MKKLEKDLYIKHAKRLNAILDEKSTFVRFLTRKDFSSVIKTELNVLAACEKLFPKVDLEAKYTAKSLAKSFNKLTKESFKVDEKYKYEDETDLIDSINYLYTFCNNMFKVNLDDLVGGKNVTATDPQIDLKAKPIYDDEQGPGINPNLAFAAAGASLAGSPYENPYLVGKAYAKVNEDLQNGKLYRFKTQPKIIPIVKWLASIFMILAIAALITSAVLFFVAGDALQGTFYIIAGAFGIYPLILIMGTIVGKKSKNPNLKFYFNWIFILMFIILALIFSINDVIACWIGDLSQLSELQTTCILILRYTLIVGLAFSGLCIPCMIIGAVKNPKPDNARLEAKLKEYIDMFTAEAGGAPVPPKADVQKPTSVKESKKDSKPKKSSSKK